MLRDDRDIALNEVLIACRKAAVHYHQATELADDPQMIEMFRRMSERRQSDVHRTERLVRKMGFLPDGPHKDKQDLTRLITLSRFAVARQAERTLVEKAVNLEIDVEKTATVASQLNWDAEAANFLREIGRISCLHREEMNVSG